eukprot:CAMPEP_0196583470 /NCGR_PEP_ID=MMETSP1081-20130531/43773_1 /TAXON_ID=36882 /ORGANISM="Pyramimonas amylifera, Strain CCMP720" /LENGTH=333 /DNA_ID=CAMNT_0041904377 /DNA_START=74 /DNA_END=1071 /DNA_ORIENTATION=-
MAFRGDGKFHKRNKLFVANFPADDYGEMQFRQLCSQFGEVGEIFLGKGFIFITMETRASAEAAKEQLSKLILSPRLGPLDVRWAASNASIVVKNLGSSISNEVLFSAFSELGEVERAVVVVDSLKRMSKGFGYVEFATSIQAQKVVSRLKKEFLILPGAPWPVSVELNDANDDDVGLPEARLRDKSRAARDQQGTAHLAKEGSIEHTWAPQWLDLEKEKTKRKLELEQWYKKAKDDLFRQEQALLMKEKKENEVNNQREAAKQTQEILKKRKIDQAKEQNFAMANRQAMMQQQQQAMLMQQNSMKGMNAMGMHGMMGGGPLGNSGPGGGGGGG